jgi:FAD dependent oxidoreductase
MGVKESRATLKTRRMGREIWRRGEWLSTADMRDLIHSVQQVIASEKNGAELVRRELRAIDRRCRFSSGAWPIFQDLLARFGVATSRPIGLPQDDTPFWFRFGHPLAGFRSRREMPESADVVVIGAGLTGASAAYHLAGAVRDQKWRVVVLDQGDPASEASGRNGGNFEGPKRRLGGSIHIRWDRRQVRPCHLLHTRLY